MIQRHPIYRLRKFIVPALFAAFVLPGAGNGKTVTRYERHFALCTSTYTLSTLIGLRACDIDGVAYLLLADPFTLATMLLPAHEFHVHETSLAEIRAQFPAFAYCAALSDALRKADTLADAGITHITPRRRGIDVTVDLCPSHRSLEKNFFLELKSALGKSGLPAPIAVAVTGVWMKEHPDDLQWLLQQVKENNLNITWVNHSYHHRYKKGEPDDSNFLLEKGTDIDSEILLTEKALVAAGAVPSVFFRFPGLISNPSIFSVVVSYGLIPLGSDAWLAKNERPTDGSIVLVHANGNDPVGVARFLKLLREEKSALENGQWLLLDLRESLVETEEMKAIK